MKSSETLEICDGHLSLFFVIRFIIYAMLCTSSTVAQ